MKKIERKKSIQLIMVMVAFIGLSYGLWNNFMLLWIENNHVSASSISRMISLGSLLSCVGLLVISMKVTRSHLKSLLAITMGVKVLSLFTLACGNGFLSTKVIAFFIIVDTMCDVMMTTGIYPMMTLIQKDDKVYGQKDLIRYIFEDLGILFGGIFVGKVIGQIFFDYNTFVIISCVLLLASFICLLFVRVPKKKHDENASVRELFTYMKQQPLLFNVLLYYFIGDMAYSCVFDLQMLIYTNLLSFSVAQSTFFILGTNLFADCLSLFLLKHFHFKNERMLIWVKYGIRAIGYLIAVLLNQNLAFILAIILATMTSTLFEDVLDGSYINLIPDTYQVAFFNVGDVVSRLGMAVGVFLCGILYPYGIRAILIAGSITTFLTVVMCHRSYSLKKRLFTS